LSVSGRSGGLIYFDVPPTRGEGRVLLGQAFVELGPDTFAALEVEAGLADKEMAIATFEAVLAR